VIADCICPVISIDCGFSDNCDFNEELLHQLTKATFASHVARTYDQFSLLHLFIALSIKRIIDAPCITCIILANIQHSRYKIINKVSTLLHYSGYLHVQVRAALLYLKKWMLHF
jgi:hypothetical protein